MNKKSIFADNLKNLRKKHGLTQKEMYEIMGCSQSTYSGYENGTSLPSVEMLINLHNSFNISIDQLIGTDSDTSPTCFKTAGDIINILFKFDENNCITVSQAQCTQIEAYDNGSGIQVQEIPVQIPALLIHDHNIQKPYFDTLLKEWKEVKEFCSTKEVGHNMYELWKKDTLEQAYELDLYIE